MGGLFVDDHVTLKRVQTYYTDDHLSIGEVIAVTSEVVNPKIKVGKLAVYENAQTKRVIKGDEVFYIIREKYIKRVLKDKLKDKGGE